MLPSGITNFTDIVWGGVNIKSVEQRTNRNRARNVGLQLLVASSARNVAPLCEKGLVFPFAPPKYPKNTDFGFNR